jgi:hypothetical protein
MRIAGTGAVSIAKGALSITSAAKQLKLYPSVINAESSMLFYTTPTGGTEWAAGQGVPGAGAGNFGISGGSGGLALKILGSGAVSMPYGFTAATITTNALSSVNITTDTIAGTNGATMNIGNTSGTLNLACGSGVQTVNVGASGEGVTTINLGGAGDTVNLSSVVNCSGNVSCATFKMTTGATAGYQLISDASGNATWSVPTASMALAGDVTGTTAASTVVSAQGGFAVNGTMSSTGAATLGGLILPTTDGTASTLSYYEDSFSWNFNIIGPFSGTSAVTAIVTRVGNIVSIRLPSTRQTIASVSTQTFQPATTDDYLPARFRPSVSVYGYCVVRDNSASVPGLYVGLTTGSFRIGRVSDDAAAFTATGNSGFLPHLIQYSLN